MEAGIYPLQENGDLLGDLLGYPHPIAFKRRADAGQTSENGKILPTYDAVALINDREVSVGAAWEETAKNGASSYYSVKFDRLGPLVEKTIRARLVPSNKEVGVAVLFWDTPEEVAAYKAGKSANKVATTATQTLAMA